MAKATTSLGFIEDKLRRLFRLTGEINSSFSPAASSVVVVADARDPGNNFTSGRRFSLSTFLGSAGATSTMGVKFAQPTIIDAMSCGITVAGSTVSFLFAPADAGADPFAIATMDAVWTELSDKTTDRAPVFRSAVNAGGLGLGPAFWRVNQAALGDHVVWPGGSFQVQAGTRLFAQCADVAGLGAQSWWTIVGRI